MPSPSPLRVLMSMGCAGKGQCGFKDDRTIPPHPTTLMVVDDVDLEVAAFEVIAQQYGWRGPRFISATTVQDAIKAASSRIDFAILDYHMHRDGTTGVDVLRAVKRANPDAFVIVLSGAAADNRVATECYDAGASVVISKRVDFAEGYRLQSAILAVLSAVCRGVQ